MKIKETNFLLVQNRVFFLSVKNHNKSQKIIISSQITSENIVPKDMNKSIDDPKFSKKNDVIYSKPYLMTWLFSKGQVFL